MISPPVIRAPRRAGRRRRCRSRYRARRSGPRHRQPQSRPTLPSIVNSPPAIRRRLLPRSGRLLDPGPRSSVRPDLEEIPELRDTAAVHHRQLGDLLRVEPANRSARCSRDEHVLGPRGERHVTTSLTPGSSGGGSGAAELPAKVRRRDGVHPGRQAAGMPARSPPRSTGHQSRRARSRARCSRPREARSGVIARSVGSKGSLVVRPPCSYKRFTPPLAASFPAQPPNGRITPGRLVHRGHCGLRGGQRGIRICRDIRKFRAPSTSPKSQDSPHTGRLQYASLQFTLLAETRPEYFPRAFPTRADRRIGETVETRRAGEHRLTDSHDQLFGEARLVHGHSTLIPGRASGVSAGVSSRSISRFALQRVTCSRNPVSFGRRLPGPLACAP